MLDSCKLFAYFFNLKPLITDIDQFEIVSIKIQSNSTIESNLEFPLSTEPWEGMRNFFELIPL